MPAPPICAPQCPRGEEPFAWNAPNAPAWSLAPSSHLNLNACFLEGAKWANPQRRPVALMSESVHAFKCRLNSGAARS